VREAKFTGDAFYIGSSKNHITIMKNSDGFHHSMDVTSPTGQKVHNTGPQHTAATIKGVLEHVVYNHKFYSGEPAIKQQLEGMLTDPVYIMWQNS
jgi:hypothetical protein